MRTLLVALCATLVFSAAAAAGGATHRSSAVDQVTLTVSKGGTGTGLVTSNPAGISCGITCSGQFAIGTTVFLTAEPSPGSNGGYSAFAGYSENCTPFARQTTEPDKLPRPLPWCKVTVSGDTTVQALFDYFPPDPPCVVPNVKGMTVYHAKRRLWSGHCHAGQILHFWSRKVKKGRVFWQDQPQGSRLVYEAPVDLAVSKGRR